MMLTVVLGAFPFVAEAKEQTVDIDGIVYEFGKKSEYEIDSSEPSDNADKEFRIGTPVGQGGPESGSRCQARTAVRAAHSFPPAAG